MARSPNGTMTTLIVALVGYVVFAQLTAFVAPSPSSRISGRQLRSRVSLAASQQEIADAQKKVDLLQWAADTAAKQGIATAGAMQAKAANAKAELEALKSGGSAPPPVPVPVASAPVQAAPAAVPMAAAVSGTVDQTQLLEAQKQADLMVWAAKAAAEKGMPTAGMLKSKADAAVAAYQALKAGNSAPMSSAPVAAAPAATMGYSAPAAVATSQVSPMEIAEAERHYELLAWAAKKATEKGYAAALQIQQKADAAAAALAAMKSGANSAAPAPVASMPVASAPAVSMPAAAAPSLSQDLSRFDLNGDGLIDQHELSVARRELDLLLWAAQAAQEKGLPQAATIKAKGEAFKSTFQALEDIFEKAMAVA